MWLRRSLFLAEVLLGPDLKTEVVHNIVAVGSTTPPPPLPPFFPASSRCPLGHSPLSLSPSFSPSRLPPSRVLARWTLSSIKAEGIDGEMIEHCASQCSSMYRPALRARREYVIHRSNWTMIDDVTSPFRPSLSPARLAAAASLLHLCLLSSLFVVFSLSLSIFSLPLSLSRSLPHFER